MNLKVDYSSSESNDDKSNDDDDDDDDEKGFLAAIESALGPFSFDEVDEDPLDLWDTP